MCYFKTKKVFDNTKIFNSEIIIQDASDSINFCQAGARHYNILVLPQPQIFLRLKNRSRRVEKATGFKFVAVECENI
jgi:hypothetical protein